MEFRVRHHDTIARIEVNPRDIEKIAADPLRSQIVDKMRSLGFKFITVDLQGFRSGSLNEPLSEQEKLRTFRWSQCVLVVWSPAQEMGDDRNEDDL